MVAFTRSVRPYFLTTDAVEYHLYHIEQRYPRLSDELPLPQQPCCFMTVTAYAAGNINIDELMSIDCIRCFKDKENNNDYYDYYRQRFATTLVSYYGPHLSPHAAHQIANTFVEITATINATYGCTDLDFFAAHTLRIVYINSFEVEVGPTARPASKASVRELLELEAKEVGDEFFYRCDECVICMELMMGMWTTTLIRMPCSHMFHKDCLVEWLDNSHVCPFCRYELPVEPDC